MCPCVALSYTPGKLFTFFDKFYGLVTFTFFARSVRFAKDKVCELCVMWTLSAVMSPLSSQEWHFIYFLLHKIWKFVLLLFGGVAVYSQVWKCDSMRSNKIMLCTLAEKRIISLFFPAFNISGCRSIYKALCIVGGLFDWKLLGTLAGFVFMASPGKQCITRQHKK